MAVHIRDGDDIIVCCLADQLEVRPTMIVLPGARVQALCRRTVDMCYAGQHSDLTRRWEKHSREAVSTVSPKISHRKAAAPFARIHMSAAPSLFKQDDCHKTQDERLKLYLNVSIISIEEYLSVLKNPMNNPHRYPKHLRYPSLSIQERMT